MRRPLCLAALVWTLVLWMLLKVRPPAKAAVPDQRYLQVTGRIERIEESREEGQMTLTLRPSDVRGFSDGEGEAARQIPFPDGNILCETDMEEVHIGQTVTLTGTCRAFPPATNPGQTDYSLYYHILGYTCRLRDARIGARSESYSHFRDWLYQIRSHLLLMTDRCYSTKEAALVRAMLFGSRAHLGDEKDRFYESGFYWLLNVSSLQISLAGGAVYSALRRRWSIMPAACGAMAVILLYGLVCGSGLRLVRAMILFLLRMTARLLHRTYDLLTGTAVAAMLLLWQQPLYLCHSGFLLSFTALLAAGILMPEAGRGRKDLVPRLLLLPLVLLPVQLYFFYTVSLWQIPVRMLSVPVTAAVLACTGAGLALGLLSEGAALVCPPLGLVLLCAARAAGIPAALLLRGLNWLSGIELKLPGSVITVGRPSLLRIAAYLALLTGAVLLRDRRARNLCRILFPVMLLALAMPSRPAGLEVCYLDVGQGDGILVRTREAVVLIDGGSATDPTVGTGILVPCLQSMGIRRIDLAIVSHTDEDHINGMEEILAPSLPCGIRIDRLALPDIGLEERGSAYHRLEREALAGDAEVLYLSRGDRVRAGEMTFLCLHPEQGAGYETPNAGSVTLLMEYKGRRFLFTGDLERDGEAACLAWCRQDPALCAELGDLVCLKTAHHGSRYATTEDWLDTVGAAYAVISCGRNNIYGHPAGETVDRLTADGMRILTTPACGCVIFRLEGQDLHVQTIPP